MFCVISVFVSFTDNVLYAQSVSVCDLTLYLLYTAASNSSLTFVTELKTKRNLSHGGHIILHSTKMLH